MYIDIGEGCVKSQKNDCGGGNFSVSCDLWCLYWVVTLFWYSAILSVFIVSLVTNDLLCFVFIVGLLLHRSNDNIADFITDIFRPRSMNVPQHPWHALLVKGSLGRGKGLWLAACNISVDNFEISRAVQPNTTTATTVTYNVYYISYHTHIYKYIMYTIPQRCQSKIRAVPRLFAPTRLLLKRLFSRQDEG